MVSSHSRIDYGEYTVLMGVYVLLFTGAMLFMYWFMGVEVDNKETIALAIATVVSSAIFVIFVGYLSKSRAIKTSPQYLS